ncbi:translocation/assembly module TamB domain-containing protein [Desulfurobacterium indicum]|nr:translocation/assembly module TamB domain-containing protein [Desulfurobacterium indicum]
MIDYYLDKLKGYGIYVENLHIQPGSRFAVTFGGIEYKSKSVEFHGGRGEVILDLIESLKEKRPVVFRASIDYFSLSFNENDKKGALVLPNISSVPFGIVVKNLHVGRGNIYSRNFLADFGGLDWGNGKFLLRKTDGRIKGKPFYLSDIVGVLQKDTVKTDPFDFSWDSLSLSGKMMFSLDFRDVRFDGKLLLPGKKVALVLIKETSKIKASGNIAFETFKKRFDFSLDAYLDGEAKFNGKISEEGEPFKLSFKGFFDGEQISIEGDSIGDFTFENKFFVKGMNVSYSFSGKPDCLSGFINGKIDDVSFDRRNFRNLFVSVKLKDSNYLDADFSWHDGNSGKVKISGNLALKNFSVVADIKKFDLKSDPLIASLSPSIREWIPEVEGDVSLKGKVEKGEVKEANVTFNISRFNFRGFDGKGYLILRTKNGRFPVSFKISGYNGTVGFSGYFNPSQVSVNGNLFYNNFQLASLDFLSSEGLEGAVTGGGKIFGKLIALRGNFRYKARELSYFGEKFEDVSGIINLDYPSLIVEARDSKGRLDLKRVSLKFAPVFAIDVVASVKGFHLGTIEKVTGRYGIKMPVKLSGTADGSVSLSFKHGEKNPFKMSVIIDKYDSHYALGDTISGNATGAGSVAFDRQLSISLHGSSKDATIAGLKFFGGSYRFVMRGKDINVSGENFSSSLFDKSSVSFSVALDAEKESMNGEFILKGHKKLSHLATDVNLSGKIEGYFDNFTVPIKGNAFVVSDYLKDKIAVKFSGRFHEPDNNGEIDFISNKGRVYAKINGKDLTLRGTLKNLEFGLEKVKGTAGLVVFNLNVKNFDFEHLNGVVGIPILSIFPENLPEIDSISGIYLNFSNGNIKVSDAAFSFPGGWINLNLSFVNRQLSGNFKGSVSARAIARRFLPSVLVKEGDFNVSGTFEYEKKFTYSVEVKAGGIVGRTDYLLGTVKIDKFSLNVKDGKLKYLFTAIEVEDGNIVVSGGDVITASIFNVPVGQRGIWRARITGNLKFVNKKLTGAINISRPVILKLTAEKKKGSPSFSIPFDVDVNLDFLEPLEFKTDVWSIKILPIMKVTVNDGIPVVSGNFFVLDGKIKYMGKEFVVSYGSGIVDNLLELKGDLNIAAISRIGDYYVYMFIRGNLSSPVLYFSSEPPLTKEEILSLIMTGATPSEMERSNELFPVVQVAYYATSTFLKPVEKTFSKLLKLESFSLEPYITRYGETVIKFSVAKRIGDRLRLIGYQTTGQDPEFSIGAQYFIGHYKNVYLEYQYSNYYHNEYGIGFDFRVKDWIWLEEKIKRKIQGLKK